MTSKCFLLSRKVCLPVQNNSFCPKLRYFTDQNGPKDDHMKMNFDYSHIKWWLLQIVRVEKVDEKNEIICLVSTFSSWVMVLKLFKKVHFMQFCAELSKKSKPVKAISINAFEISHHTLSETGVLYRGLE